MEKTIFILRHGQTDYNRQGIVQGGGVDSSLNETGEAQAQAFYEKYAGEGFEVVLTSTLQRTHQTVRSFIESGIPWEQFPEIDEMSWGVHEGQKPDATMIAEYKTLMEHWKNEQYDAKLDGGESARQLGQRIDRFIEILKKRPERKILVCTHGRALRALICRMKNQPLKNMEHVGHKNTGLYIAQFDGNEFHFLTENERSHWTRPAT